MSGERAESLPRDLREWLDDRAAADDVGTDDILVRALAAYRFVEEEGETLTTIARSQEALSEEVARLSKQLSTIEGDFDEKIDDVRRRVVQVKREADGKAPLDHDHPTLEERVETAGAVATDTRERVGHLDERLERGFENYEDILTYLRDTANELDDKTTRLARVVVDLRNRTAQLEATVAERTAVADLQRIANQLGISSAKCDDCGSTVHLGLLADPRCPHCAETFTDVEPARGFFGSPVLTVGERPALDGEVERTETVDDLLGEEEAHE